jgi:helicase
MTIDLGPDANDLLELLRDRGFQNEVAQVRAKSLLSEIEQYDSGTRWRYDVVRLARNGTGAVSDLENAARRAPQLFSESDDLRQASLRVAQLWESLGRIREGSDRQPAWLNAALAYELAGYQANAVCLAARLLDTGLVRENAVLSLSSTFLRRLFLAVLKDGAPMRRAPELANLAGPALFRRAASAAMATGLVNGARFFLSGQLGWLTDADRYLALAWEGFSQLGLVDEANSAHLTRTLLPVMASKSTWTALRNVHPGNAKWDRYLKLLARGPGSYVIRTPSVSELWPSQQAAIDMGLFTNDHGMVVRVPTSAGKTRIAEMAMVHTLATSPGARCLYVAPYRALVSELQNSFLNIFADLGYRVSSFLGAYDADAFEQALATEADVLIITPERLDLLLRLQPEFFDSVRMVVLDEGHIADDLTRGAKYELLLSRLKVRLPDARFIFLSAVIPEETLLDFASWLRAGDSVVRSSWRPSVLRVARFEWRGDQGFVEYERSDDLEFPGEFLRGVIQQRTYEHVHPVTRHTRRPKFPSPAHRAQTVAELGFRFAQAGPVLVFCPQTDLVEAVAQAYALRLELTELVDEPVPAFFRTPDTRSVRVAEDWLGPDHKITQWLRKGIAIHHGRLPDVLRNAIETDYRERKYRILVATNTLAQGVNLPIRTVIIHSTRRRIDRDTEERISAREYWNIAGRAGRAGWETEGTVIHLLNTARDRQDYAYFLASRDAVEPVQSVLLQLMNGLIQQRWVTDEVAEYLDADLLALMAEEDPDELGRSLDAVLDQSLAAVQARRLGQDIESLRVVFHSAKDRIIEQVPQAGRRRTFRDTGLSLASNLSLEQKVQEEAGSLRELLLSADSQTYFGLEEIILAVVVTLPEMEPTVDVPISYSDALVLWLQGNSTVDVHTELLGQTLALQNQDDLSLERFGRWVGDFFSYRLPWGTAAFLRVACASLDIDPNQLSPHTKALPAMVKFGVPLPEAAWAMSAGIPFRRLAISLAARFRAEHAGMDNNEFREWLASVEESDLRQEYRLEGDVLQDVALVLSRSAPSPLLRNLQSLESQLPIETSVAGVAYEGRWQTAALAQVGMSINLSRDYDNTIDRNAIEVLLEGQILGFVPRSVAAFLAPEMDAGVFLTAEITNISDGPRRAVDIRIRQPVALT